MASNTFVVSVSTDDCYVQRVPATTFILNTAYVPVGDYSSELYDYEGGMRWEVDIPQGAIINSAYLKLVSNLKYGGPPEITIEGEDADDPATFSTFADYDGRSRTSQSVLWTPSPWTPTVEYTSPDIKTIIQAIVNRPGFGTHIVLFISEPTGWGGVMNLVGAASYDDVTFDPPKLVVTWNVVAYEKTLTENLGLVDKVVKAPSVTKSELLGLLDTYSRTWAAYRVYPEILGLSDTVVKAPALIKMESLGLVDTVAASKLLVKILTELLGLSDTVRKDAFKVLTEGLGLVDTYSRIWAAYRTYSELLGLADAVAKMPSKTFPEALGLSDTVMKTALIVKSEMRGLLDSISYTPNPTALAKLIRKYLQLASMLWRAV